MYTKQCSLESLASRARQGDSEAGAALHRALERQMPYLVRQALRKPSTAFDERVKREAEKVAAACQPGRISAEHMLRQVEWRMCDAVWRQLVQPTGRQHWHLETVPNC